MNSLMNGSSTSPLAALSIAYLFTLSCAASDSDNKPETILASTSALETTNNKVRIHQSSNQWWQQVRVPSGTSIVAIDNGDSQWLLEGNWWGDFVSNRYISRGSDVRLIISNGTTPWVSGWFPYLLQQPTDSEADFNYHLSSQHHLIVHQHSNKWWQQIVPLVPVNWIDIRYKGVLTRMHHEDYGHFTSNLYIEPGSQVELFFEIQSNSDTVMKTAKFHYLADQPVIELPCPDNKDVCHSWGYVCAECFPYPCEPQACVRRAQDGELCSSRTTSRDCETNFLCVNESPMTSNSYCHQSCATHHNCPSGKLCFHGICSEPVCHLAITKTESGYNYHASFVDAGWTNFGFALSQTILSNQVYSDQLAGSCEMVSPQCDSLPQEPLCVTNQFGQQQEVNGPCAALRLMLANIEQPESFITGQTYEWIAPKWQSTLGTCN